MHDRAPFLIDVLVALAFAAHGKSGVHVHVVTGKVQTDE